MLPGTDPVMRDDVVIFTAHWDHLGVRDAVDGDSIYNGFSDNAAGVAMLLAIAQAWRETPSARSVAFLFLGGEEEGLLGSAYYTAAPLLPLARTVAVINLDAGAPPVPPVSWRFAGTPTSSLSQLANEITRSHGWTADLGPARPNSDHWPFLARNVPAVFIVPGNKWEGVSDDERNKLRERWDHYHQASDHWAIDFPFAGLQRYASLALEIGKRVATSRAPQP
jgi:Zn-dependent M28 family amino/carboxypeptidase